MARAGRALMLERFQLGATAAGIAALYDRHFTPANGAGLHGRRTAFPVAARDAVMMMRTWLPPGKAAAVA